MIQSPYLSAQEAAAYLGMDGTRFAARVAPRIPWYRLSGLKCDKRQLEPFRPLVDRLAESGPPDFPAFKGCPFERESQMDQAQDEFFTSLGCEVFQQFPIFSTCCDVVVFSTNGEVWAIESKLAAWRAGIAQARRHLPAVDRSYIALPERRKPWPDAVVEDALASGVGVLLVGAGWVETVAQAPHSAVSWGPAVGQIQNTATTLRAWEAAKAKGWRGHAAVVLDAWAARRARLATRG